MYSLAGSLIIREDMRQPLESCHRTVLRSTPSRFSIEHFLSTGNSTGKCHHGMHISSDTRGKCASISSRGSLSEYDIWRSWEDCLWFQQTLEEEYGRAAREKKRRLAQGKGVKGFNGLYKKDLASSWESLPVGPDPKSVAQDIHKHLPTLARRGTIFRASQAVIDQRQADLIDFIQALFSDDMPALIKEIRVSSVVSEFFGLWRTDFDIAEESQTSTTVPRKSLTNSVFSSYFSASHPSLPSSDTAPSSPKSYNKSYRSTTPRPRSTENFEEPRYPCGSSRRSRSRSRPLSTSSDSSARSESSSDTSLSSSSGPAIADNVPIVFGHNPSEQFNSILEVLPEEQDALPKSPEPYREVKPRPRASATERKARRSYSIFGLSLQKSLLSSERLDDRSVRESWQSADSRDSTANDLLDGLGLVLPHAIKEQKFRASIASISTFMTTDSADAVIPQTPRASAQQCSLSTRISTSLSLSDFDVYSDADGDGNYSVLDAFPRPISSIPEIPESGETPESLVGDLPMPTSPSSIRTAFNCPPSPTSSSISNSAFSTTSTLLPAADSISIKAIHDTSIILLRVPRGIGFAEVRQRLYNKFIGQEGIPLSQTYDVVFVPPNPSPACSNTSADRTDAQVITLESDWEQLVSTLQGNKITLRIQDIST